MNESEKRFVNADYSLSSAKKTYKSLPALSKVKSEEYMNRDMENEAYKVIVGLYQEKYPLADKEEKHQMILGDQETPDYSVSTIVVEDDTDTIDEHEFVQTQGNTNGGGAKLFQEEERHAHIRDKRTSSTLQHYYNKKIDHVETPGKIRKKQPTPGVSVETIDDFTKDYVGQVIYRMYHEGKHVLMDSILSVIRSTGIDFHGGKSTLSKLPSHGLQVAEGLWKNQTFVQREYLQYMSDSIYVDFVYLDETTPWLVYIFHIVPRMATLVSLFCKIFIIGIIHYITQILELTINRFIIEKHK
uniref:Uncharacterized protein n=1 Tax=Timema poppense TaxID=170557 RepID=A0A7R9HCT1_TIMPO|nr:unnamed protein product [Timema poppensis]